MNDHKLYEIAEELRRLFHAVLGEKLMSQIQFTLTLTVNPSAPPLAEGSSSGSLTFTQGVQSSQILTQITGGVPPYTASVDAASPAQLPPGLAAGIDPNNNLIISGTASAAGGPSDVLLDVTDSAGDSVAKVKANIR